MNGLTHVWNAVEDFRRQHPTGNTVPVDVFSIVELELRLDVVPFDDLSFNYGMEAAITQDFTGIYVDAESYLLWERGPVWKQNRLRFSVAHEVGHLVLHRDAAAKIKFKSFQEFARYFNADDWSRFHFEQEANEFAGRLLVPLDRLQANYDAYAAQIRSIVPNWWTSGEMRQKFAESAAPKFGVHPQVIETRLDREGIWPAA